MHIEGILQRTMDLLLSTVFICLQLGSGRATTPGRFVYWHSVSEASLVFYFWYFLVFFSPSVATLWPGIMRQYGVRNTATWDEI